MQIVGVGWRCMTNVYQYNFVSSEGEPRTIDKHPRPQRDVGKTSAVILVFRQTEWTKYKKVVEPDLPPNLPELKLVKLKLD